MAQVKMQAKCSNSILFNECQDNWGENINIVTLFFIYMVPLWYLKTNTFFPYIIAKAPNYTFWEEERYFRVSGIYGMGRHEMTEVYHKLSSLEDP